MKPTAPDNNNPPQKRKCYGVSCNVYNPVNVPLCDLRIRDQLMPTLVAHMDDDPIPVTCQFGSVPSGCMLSYQAPIVKGTTSMSVTDPPNFIFPDFVPVIVPGTTSHLLYTSLQVSADESRQFL